MITYIATNTINGRFYIGSSINFEKRKKDHLKATSNFPFHRDLRRNPDAFVWENWEDDYEEPILEQALLDMWHGKGNCYNLSPYASRPPGNSGIPHTILTKQKISIATKGKGQGEKNNAKRPEARIKISLSKTGKPRSQETKDKISITCKDRKWKWWVNEKGERKHQAENPGEGWKRGMKWRFT